MRTMRTMRTELRIFKNNHVVIFDGYTQKRGTYAGCKWVGETCYHAIYFADLNAYVQYRQVDDFREHVRTCTVEEITT